MEFPGENETLIAPFAQDLFLDVTKCVILVLEATISVFQHVSLVEGLPGQSDRSCERKDPRDPPSEIGGGDKHAEEAKAEIRK